MVEAGCCSAVFVSQNLKPVFRYGQTGTGKTFTMEGERSTDGDYTWEEVHFHLFLLLLGSCLFSLLCFVFVFK